MADRDDLEHRLERWLSERDAGEIRDAYASVDAGLERATAPAWSRSPLRRFERRVGTASLVFSSGIAVVAVVLAIVTVIRTVGSPVGSTLPPAGPAPPSATTPGESVTLRQPVPSGDPIAVLGTPDGVWVASQAGTMTRLDADTGNPTASIDLPGNACGPLTLGAESIWLRVCPAGPGETVTSSWLVQIDHEGGRLTRSIRFDSFIGPEPAVVGPTAWVVASMDSGRLVPVDVLTGALGPERYIDTAVTHATGAFGAVWLSSPESGQLLRLDPSSNAVDRVAVPAPGFLTATVDQMWVSSGTALQEVDPITLDYRRRIDTGATPLQMAALDGDVWALAGTTLLRIPHGANAASTTFDIGPHTVQLAPQFTGPTFSMGISGESVWHIPPRGDLVRLRVP